jgi:hypothetical protein
MTDNLAGGRPYERFGYVYVISTVFTNKADLPIIKIGRTHRTPSQRNKELSRGSPVAMKLVGAVTTRDAVALERKAHRAFSGARVSGGGGTEYFAVNPDDVLAWLRAEEARFEIDSAARDAWRREHAEYAASRQGKVERFCNYDNFFLYLRIINSGYGRFFMAPCHLLMALATPFLAAGRPRRGGRAPFAALSL